MADRSRLWFPFHHLSIFVFLMLFIHGHSLGIGVSPQNFYKGDILEVKANNLASTKTDVAYSYYSLPYCRPIEIVDYGQNLGEIFRGYRVQNSPYKFSMRVTSMCNVVCLIKLNEKTAKELKEKIDDEYRANMILEDLPLVTKTNHDFPTDYQLGYFVGGKVRYENTTEEKYFINNHLSFIVRYHQNLETPSARVVGFEVKAFSINHRYDGEQWNLKGLCDSRAIHMVTGSDPPQEVDDQKEIIFTYDVEFRESDVKWASRWDTYNLLTTDDQIHWFSILKSLLIVLSISGMVAMIMLRKLHRDIFEYDQLDTLEDAQEETETGWKLVHTDVFRSPVNSSSLCVLVGTGVQLYCTVLLTVIFGVFGILSTSYYQTEPIMVVILIWALMGIFGGLATARLYRSLGGSDWNVKTTLATACLFPGTVFCILVLHGVTQGEDSWGVVPFDAMFGLLFLWLVLSVPLVFVGAYISFIEPEVKEPVKTSKIPREIQKQGWYMSPFMTIMIGGVLPFGAVFNEFFMMLTSIGLPQFYYMFGLVFVILIITCAEVTILLCYFQLCREDYRWWWRSYLTAGSSAFHLFMYATFHFFTKLNITELVPGVLYFGYTLIVCFALFVLTGTIGFYACLWFVRHLYSSLKIV